MFTPDSPDLSLLENLGSKLKTILGSIKARTYQELGKAIELAFNEVDDLDLLNWSTHCCYCTSSP